MGQAGDDGDAGERVDVPGHEPEQLLGPDRIEADRPGRDDVAEAEHHRRDEHRNQQQRLDPAAPRQVGPDHQEGEDAAERHRDQRHRAGDHERVLERVPEVVVGEDELERADAEAMRREERRVEQALIEDEPEREEDGECRQADDARARQRNAHYLPAFIAACHCLMKSSRLVWSR